MKKYSIIMKYYCAIIFMHVAANYRSILFLIK